MINILPGPVALYSGDRAFSGFGFLGGKTRPGRVNTAAAAQIWTSGTPAVRACVLGIAIRSTVLPGPAPLLEHTEQWIGRHKHRSRKARREQQRRGGSALLARGGSSVQGAVQLAAFGSIDAFARARSRPPSAPAQHGHSHRQTDRAAPCCTSRRPAIGIGHATAIRATKHTHAPSPSPPRPQAPARGPARRKMSGGPTFQWIGKGAVDKDRGRTYFARFAYGSDVIASGDCVYLLPEDDARPRYLARILSAYEEHAAGDADRFCIEVCGPPGSEMPQMPAGQRGARPATAAAAPPRPANADTKIAATAPGGCLRPPSTLPPASFPAPPPPTCRSSGSSAPPTCRPRCAACCTSARWWSSRWSTPPSSPASTGRPPCCWRPRPSRCVPLAVCPSGGDREVGPPDSASCQAGGRAPAPAARDRVSQAEPARPPAPASP
jgi:hypothetical protein